jgi:hypothetical protein
MTGDTVAIV